MSEFENGAAHTIFHSPRRNTLPTSGCATIVFWQIGVLETIVYNLKIIFANLNIVIAYLFDLGAARQLRIGLYLITSLTLKMALPKLYFTLHAEIRYLLTSGCATIIFWQIWVLETIIHYVKSIANFGNLNVFFLYQ